VGESCLGLLPISHIIGGESILVTVSCEGKCGRVGQYNYQRRRERWQDIAGARAAASKRLLEELEEVEELGELEKLEEQGELEELEELEEPRSWKWHRFCGKPFQPHIYRQRLVF
jgi:hypothetical protein